MKALCKEVLFRILPPVGLDPLTPCFKVGSANHLGMKTHMMSHKMRQ